MKKLLLVAVSLMLMVAFSGLAVAQDAVEITVRCKANIEGGENWRCDNFAEVEAQVEADLGIDIDLNLIQDNKGWGDYKNEFVLASEAGEAPDIILSGHEDIGAWAPAGFIIPLDDLMTMNEEFDDLIQGLMPSQMFNGEIYGIPQDSEARPIFFSKLLLADLGWSEEEIESLADRIRDGEFTFADMVATAQQAVDEGVVAEGNGFWHRPSNGPDFLYYYYGMGGEVLDGDTVIVDSDALLAAYSLLGGMTSSGVTRSDLIGIDWGEEWHPSVASAEEVLFTAGGTWNWADWARNYVADRDGDGDGLGNDYLLENIGLALIPAMETGNALTLTHPLSYMVSSQSENPDVAMALIAAITTAEANNRHAIDSFHLGVVNEQVNADPYASDPILSSAHYMLDYATALPNHPGWNAWSNAYFAGITAVESGEATPEEAVELMTSQLTNELEGVEVR